MSVCFPHWLATDFKGSLFINVSIQYQVKVCLSVFKTKNTSLLRGRQNVHMWAEWESLSKNVWKRESRGRGYDNGLPSFQSLTALVCLSLNIQSNMHVSLHPFSLLYLFSFKVSRQEEWEEKGERIKRERNEVKWKEKRSPLDLTFAGDSYFCVKRKEGSYKENHSTWIGLDDAEDVSS